MELIRLVKMGMHIVSSRGFIGKCMMFFTVHNGLKERAALSIY